MMKRNARTVSKYSVLASLLVAVMASSPAFCAEVTDGAICTAVVDRACEGAAAEFPTGVGKVLAFTRLLGMKSGDTVTHRWIYESQVMREIQLTIGGPEWRTWSSKNIDPLWAGAWKVEVVEDSSGTVLKTMTFTIK